uniref:Uncharacterized protein n=1 Tax=Pseudo-nitzschia arenysensis TaxID=697910 RepID=A0A6T9YMQ9_9STRA|mmetsp:Transcript_659/g.1566  ORF Transcript_659/g.1566 Transcript_659/m.1566 type:complete len:331 (+) Transcript_659:102-1094(+)
MRTTSSILSKFCVAFSFVSFTRIFWDVHGFLLANNVRRNFGFERGGSMCKDSDNMHGSASPTRVLINSNDEEDYDENKQHGLHMLQSRDSFLRIIQNGGLALAATSMIPSEKVLAFDGGVGGLGKTKPDTGVELFDETSAPIQNDKGIVSSEIKGADGSPVLVSFQTPWPLLPTSAALEARDIRSTESAFVQVVSLPSVEKSRKWKEKKQFQSVLMDSVFGAKGKFGAYGQPFDIQLKRAASNQSSSDTDYSQTSVFSVTFTTLTPAMRESERKALIAAQQVGADTLILLVVTTTSARYSTNEKTFQKIASSFEAISAPQTSLKKGSSSK